MHRAGRPSTLVTSWGSGTCQGQQKHALRNGHGATSPMKCLRLRVRLWEEREEKGMGQEREGERWGERMCLATIHHGQRAAAAASEAETVSAGRINSHNRWSVHAWGSEGAEWSTPRR